jgi:hypothetical protein
MIKDENENIKYIRKVEHILNNCKYINFSDDTENPEYYPHTYFYEDLGTIDNETIDVLEEYGIKKIYSEPNPYCHKRCNYFYGNLDNLYPGIEEIYIDSIDFTKPIHNLPITMRKIHLVCSRYDEALFNIPPELEVLILECNIFNQDINELPDSIYELKIKSLYFDKSLDALPPNLEKLYISSGAKRYTRKMLPELPYCKEIEIWYGDEKVED